MRPKLQILIAICGIVALASCKKDQKADADRSLAAGVLPIPCATCGATKGNFTFAPNTVISGTRTLCPDTKYYLGGKTWVSATGKIVIPAGTVIKGISKANPADASALVITQGGEIEASGTSTGPVIFTSQTDTTGSTPAPGDWGGVVILGSAPINAPGGTGQIEGITSAPSGVTFTYGGNSPSDNSGWMRYVRIQFASAEVFPNEELNSLTLGGIGCQTDLHHIETFKGADDGSNGIECDNSGTTPFTDMPHTKPVLSNFIIVGTSNCSATGTLLAGAQFRRNTRFILRNSIIYGYPTGLLLDNAANSNTIRWVDSSDRARTCIDSSQLFDNVIYGCTDSIVPSVATWKYHNISNTAGVSNNPPLVLTSNFPSPINNFFATNALRPTGAPAFRGANTTGLVGILCGCGLNNNFLFNTNPLLRHMG